MLNIKKPLLFKTDAELKAKIQEYFEDYCGVDEYGNIKSGFKNVPSVTSLALYLNTSRETLMNYEKREAYFDTVKTAKERILSFNESALYSKRINVVGVIFNLKNNWGWKDRVENMNTNLEINEENASKEDIDTFIKNWTSKPDDTGTTTE